MKTTRAVLHFIAAKISIKQWIGEITGALVCSVILKV